MTTKGGRLHFYLTEMAEIYLPERENELDRSKPLWWWYPRNFLSKENLAQKPTTADLVLLNQLAMNNKEKAIPYIALFARDLHGRRACILVRNVPHEIYMAVPDNYTQVELEELAQCLEFALHQRNKHLAKNRVCRRTDCPVHSSRARKAERMAEDYATDNGLKMAPKKRRSKKERALPEFENSEEDEQGDALTQAEIEEAKEFYKQLRLKAKAQLQERNRRRYLALESSGDFTEEMKDKDFPVTDERYAEDEDQALALFQERMAQIEEKYRNAIDEDAEYEHDKMERVLKAWDVNDEGELVKVRDEEDHPLEPREYYDGDGFVGDPPLLEEPADSNRSLGMQDSTEDDIGSAFEEEGLLGQEGGRRRGRFRSKKSSSSSGMNNQPCIDDLATDVAIVTGAAIAMRRGFIGYEPEKRKFAKFTLRSAFYAHAARAILEKETELLEHRSAGAIARHRRGVYEVCGDSVESFLRIKDMRTFTWYTAFDYDEIPANDPYRASSCPREFVVDFNNFTHTDPALTKEFTKKQPAVSMVMDIETISPLARAVSVADRHPIGSIGAQIIDSRDPDKARERFLFMWGDEPPKWPLDEEPDKDCETQLVFTKTEREMLEAFRKYFVSQADPDFIVGYNSNSFDLPYLFERVMANGMHLDYNLSLLLNYSLRRGSISSFSPLSGWRSSTRFELPGRACFDLLPFTIQRQKLLSYRLGDVVKSLKLGVDKMDVDYNQIYLLFHGNAEARMQLAKYNVFDVYVTGKLLSRLSGVETLMAQAKVLRSRPNDAIYYGPMARNKRLIRTWTQPNGILIPADLPRYRDRRDDDPEMTRKPLNPVYETNRVYVQRWTETAEFPGGHVFPPVRGVWPMVASFDFNSLYPSIMIAHNLCHTTFLPDTTSDEDLETRYMIPRQGILETVPISDDEFDEDFKYDPIPPDPPVFHFAKESVLPGALPKMLRTLLDARKATRRRRDEVTDPALKKALDAEQEVYKIVANSAYGLTGFRGELENIAVAASITAFGRHYIKAAWREIQRGFPDAYLVTGDTDSLMVAIPAPTLLEAKIMANKMMYAVNDSGVFPPPMRIEFERIYSQFMVINKKRYAGIEHDASLFKDHRLPGKLRIKGLEVIRRDQPAFVSDTMQKVLKMYLQERRSEGEIAKFIAGRVASIYDGTVDMSLVSVKKTFVKKRDGELDRPQPHIRAAEILMEEGFPVNSGDRIEYVFAHHPTYNPKLEEPEPEIENVKSLPQSGGRPDFGMIGSWRRTGKWNDRFGPWGVNIEREDLTVKERTQIMQELNKIRKDHPYYLMDHTWWFDPKAAASVKHQKFEEDVPDIFGVEEVPTTITGQKLADRALPRVLLGENPLDGDVYLDKLRPPLARLFPFIFVQDPILGRRILEKKFYVTDPDLAKKVEQLHMEPPIEWKPLDDGLTAELNEARTREAKGLPPLKRSREPEVDVFPSIAAEKLRHAEKEAAKEAPSSNQGPQTLESGYPVLTPKEYETLCEYAKDMDRVNHAYLQAEKHFLMMRDHDRKRKVRRMKMAAWIRAGRHPVEYDLYNDPTGQEHKLRYPFSLPHDYFHPYTFEVIPVDGSLRFLGTDKWVSRLDSIREKLGEKINHAAKAGLTGMYDEPLEKWTEEAPLLNPSTYTGYSADEAWKKLQQHVKEMKAIQKMEEIVNRQRYFSTDELPTEEEMMEAARTERLHDFSLMESTALAEEYEKELEAKVDDTLANPAYSYWSSMTESIPEQDSAPLVYMEGGNGVYESISSQVTARQQASAISNSSATVEPEARLTESTSSTVKPTMEANPIPASVASTASRHEESAEPRAAPSFAHSTSVVMSSSTKSISSWSQGSFSEGEFTEVAKTYPRSPHALPESYEPGGLLETPLEGEKQDPRPQLIWGQASFALETPKGDKVPVVYDRIRNLFYLRDDTPQPGSRLVFKYGEDRVDRSYVIGHWGRLNVDDPEYDREFQESLSKDPPVLNERVPPHAVENHEARDRALRHLSEYAVTPLQTQRLLAKYKTIFTAFPHDYYAPNPYPAYDKTSVTLWANQHYVKERDLPQIMEKTPDPVAVWRRLPDRVHRQLGLEVLGAGKHAYDTLLGSSFMYENPLYSESADEKVSIITKWAHDSKIPLTHKDVVAADQVAEADRARSGDLHKLRLERRREVYPSSPSTSTLDSASSPEVFEGLKDANTELSLRASSFLMDEAYSAPVAPRFAVSTWRDRGFQVAHVELERHYKGDGKGRHPFVHHDGKHFGAIPPTLRVLPPERVFDDSPHPLDDRAAWIQAPRFDPKAKLEVETLPVNLSPVLPPRYLRRGHVFPAPFFGDAPAPSAKRAAARLSMIDPALATDPSLGPTLWTPEEKTRAATALAAHDYRWAQEVSEHEPRHGIDFTRQAERYVVDRSLPPPLPNHRYVVSRHPLEQRTVEWDGLPPESLRESYLSPKINASFRIRLFERETRERDPETAPEPWSDALNSLQRFLRDPAIKDVSYRRDMAKRMQTPSGVEKVPEDDVEARFLNYGRQLARMPHSGPKPLSPQEKQADLGLQARERWMGKDAPSKPTGFQGITRDMVDLENYKILHRLGTQVRNPTSTDLDQAEAAAETEMHELSSLLSEDPTELVHMMDPLAVSSEETAKRLRNRANAREIIRLERQVLQRRLEAEYRAENEAMSLGSDDVWDEPVEGVTPPSGPLSSETPPSVRPPIEIPSIQDAPFPKRRGYATLTRAQSRAVLVAPASSARVVARSRPWLVGLSRNLVLVMKR